MNRDEREQLRTDKPNVWVPVDPGDFLDGDIVEVDAAWSDVQYDGKNTDSGFYPLLRVKVREATGYQPEAILTVHGFATVLRDRILTHKPAPGERVILTYEGEGNATKGRSAPQLYRVELPERDPSDAAAKVYGSMSPRRASGGNPPTQEQLPTDAPAENDIPF